MSFFDIINTDPDIVVKWLNDIGIPVSKEFVTAFMNYLALVLLIGLIILIICRIYKKADDILTFFSKTRKWRKRKIKICLEHSFGDYLVSERQKTYIRTKSQ